MNQIDPRTRENPEAAMVHAELTPAQRADCLKNAYTKDQDLRVHPPSAAFFDLPTPGGAVNDHPQAPWPWPVTIPVGTPIRVLPRTDKPEPNAVPGFDSEAHRAFMRSLG